MLVRVLKNFLLGRCRVTLDTNKLHTDCSFNRVRKKKKKVRKKKDRLGWKRLDWIWKEELENDNLFDITKAQQNNFSATFYEKSSDFLSGNLFKAVSLSSSHLYFKQTHLSQYLIFMITVFVWLTPCCNFQPKSSSLGVLNPTNSLTVLKIDWQCNNLFISDSTW